MGGDWISLCKEWQNFIKERTENINENTNIVMLLTDEYLWPRYNGSDEETDDRAIELLPNYVKVVSEYTNIL